MFAQIKPYVKWHIAHMQDDEVAPQGVLALRTLLLSAVIADANLPSLPDPTTGLFAYSLVDVLPSCKDENGYTMPLTTLYLFGESISVTMDFSGSVSAAILRNKAPDDLLTEIGMLFEDAVINGVPVQASKPDYVKSPMFLIAHNLHLVRQLAEAMPFSSALKYDNQRSTSPDSGTSTEGSNIIAP